MATIERDDRDPVEQLAETFLAEVRSGAPTTVENYAARHPEHAEQIQSLFPTLLMMEVGKPAKDKTASDGDPLLGLQVERLGDFRIERCIGRGGMGIVYEATQESLSRRVALKILSPSLLTTSDMIARFEREARAAATLHHSNIVPVYSVGDQWGVHYYAMQYIDGPGLDSVLSGGESPIEIRDDFRVIADLGRQVALGLSYAHENGTLHRDIKPANLLLDQTGTIWITDFGLAKLVDADDGLTCAGQTIGTARYMPPEQFNGNVDQRGDVYSLGLTLYELLTGQPAFQETSRSQLIRQITDGDMPTPRSVNSRIPRDLETIVLKAVSRDADLRYQTAEEMADDLQRFCHGELIQARRPYPWERIGRWAQRNPAIAVLSLLAATLLVAVAVASTVGYLKTTAAYSRVAEENARATMASSLATNTLENIFNRFAPSTSQGDDALSPQPVLSPESAQLLQDLLVFYEHLSEHSENDDLLVKAADAQNRVAQIHHQLGHHEQAIQAHERAIERYNQLPSTASNVVNIARIHNHIGHILNLTGDLERSKFEHEQAIHLLNGLRKATKQNSTDDVTVDDLDFEVARSLYLKARHIRPGLGPNSLPPVELLHRHREPSFDEVATLVARPESGSRADLERAVKLLDALVTQDPDQPARLHLLAACLVEVASDAVDVRDPGEREAEKRAIAILEKLIAAQPQAIEYQYSLLHAYTQIDLRASELLSVETLRSLCDRFETAMEIAEELVQKRSDIAIYSSTLAQTAYQLGCVQEHLSAKTIATDRRDYLVESERHYRKATNRQAALAKRYPHAAGYQVWLASFQVNLARIEHQQRQVDQAHVLISRAIRTLEKLPSDLASEPIVRRLTGRAYDQLSRILVDRGRRDRADIAKAFAEEFEDYHDRPPPPRRRRRPEDFRDLFAPPPHLR